MVGFDDPANWFEDRSNHNNPGHNFEKERRNPTVPDFTLTNNEFNKTNNNWLNFQDVPSKDTFNSVYK